MPEVIVVQGNLARQEELKCRVGAYARVSSDSDDQLNSFFNQVQHYTKLIKAILNGNMLTSMQMKV